MDYYQIAVAVHLIGFALGLGGATLSDITFLKTIRSRNLSIQHYEFLVTLSRVIWVGLGLLIVSGLVMFGIIYSQQGSLPMLASPRWQTKLSLVVIVLINGLFFRSSIFPALKNLVGKIPDLANVGPLVWRLALSGTISIVSWYGIFVVTQLPRTFRPSILYFAGIYLVLLVLGFLASKTVIRKLLK